MRKIGLILGVLFISLSVAAEKVERQTAQTIAFKFISAQQLQLSDKVVKEVHSEQVKDVVTHYVINYEPEGWMLVAADDRIKPILAYSSSGSFNSIDLEKSPEVEYWLNGYQKQIYDVVKGNTLKTMHEEWNELLLSQESTEKSANTLVEPILNVKWNQNNGWNRFCPEDEEGPGGHAYVGCVAVAMAQAMTNTKYPSAPVGEHSYTHSNYGTIYMNYNNEAPYDWNNMPLNASNDENARLLYHCAVSVNMDFGPDGSGTLSSRVVGALKEHFGYTSDVTYVKRLDDDNQWKELLKSELDKGNVLIYSGDPGTGEAGHSFNVDGYDIAGLFHFNWGWSGTYNGYYSIDNINPGDNKFNVNQDVVIGISVPYFGPTDITLSNQEVEEGMPVGSFVAKVNVEDHSAVDSFSYTLKGGPKFPSGWQEASFYIENDSLKTKYVFDASVKDEYILNIKVTDQDLNVFSKEFIIKIKEKITTAIGRPAANEIPKIYFSQSQKSIIINSNTHNYTNSNVRIVDIHGRIVATGIIDKTNYLINTSDLNTGVYIVVVEDIQKKVPRYSKKVFVGQL
ncbi:C10 family peptidase [Prolixibacteraceae bacterium Z1-6]|uniref:C10 family peptidase n=1 Tax=Draconibacterium aestuarii TaxID=2998507 RepID=A0A9X3F991_9BACT|nr:C10 family peptidase [Prolixibacteraceae bacterium Z1-6]